MQQNTTLMLQVIKPLATLMVLQLTMNTKQELIKLKQEHLLLLLQVLNQVILIYQEHRAVAQILEEMEST